MSLLLASALFFSLAGQTGPHADTSLSLYRDCQTQIRVWESNDDKQITDSDLRHATNCLSYIEGYLDGLDDSDNKNICTLGASYGSLIRVYVAYMQNNPKLLDSPRNVGINYALRNSYKCSSK